MYRIFSNRRTPLFEGCPLTYGHPKKNLKGDKTFSGTIESLKISGGSKNRRTDRLSE